MKYYGQITDDKDLVNKKYVDDNSGSTPNDGKLKLGLDSEEAIDLFSANQSSNSTLTLVGGTNISLSRDQVDKNKITITGTGGGTIYDSNLNLSINGGTAEKVFSANAEKAGTIDLSAGTGISLSQSGSSITITNTGSSGFDGVNSVNTIISVPVNKKNCVATIDKGESLSFSSLASAFELNLYVIAPAAVGGGSGAITIGTTIGGYPVIYNGVYNSSSASYPIINLVTSVQGESEKLTITSRTAATFHILFNGSILFIDRYYFNTTVN